LRTILVAAALVLASGPALAITRGYCGGTEAVRPAHEGLLVGADGRLTTYCDIRRAERLGERRLRERVPLRRARPVRR